MYKKNKENYHLFLAVTLFTAIIFIIYSFTNTLNFILGKKYLFNEINYQFTCENLNFYCRNLTYEFFKFFFSIFSNNPYVVYFFQLFLFSYSCLYLIEKIKFKKKDTILKFIFFLIIFSNPKVFKYCFSLTEEALFISLITICLGLFIHIFTKYSLKNFVILSFLLGITYAVRPAGIFLILLPIIIFYRNFNLIKLRIILIIILLLMPLQINNAIFYKIHSIQQPSFFWGTILGKIPLFAQKINLENKNNIEFQKILIKLNQQIYDDLEILKTHTLKQFHRNSSIELFKTAEVAGEVKIIKNYLETKELHSNEIIKETFYDLLKVNYISFIKELFLNYLGIWELREILTKKNHDKYNNYLNKKSINFYEKYNHILQSTTHPNIIVIFAKIFMLFFFLINLLIFYNYVVNYKKNDDALYKDLQFYFILLINFYFIVVCISTNVQTRLILTIWPIISFTIIFFMLQKFLKINFNSIK